MRMNRLLFPTIVASFLCVGTTPAQEPSAVPQAVENEVKRRLEADRLDRARRDLASLIAKAEAADTMLTDIEKKAEGVNERLKDLLTSPDGKRIAQDFKASNTVLRLREQPFAYAADIRAKRQAATSLLNLLTGEEKNPKVGYIPPDKTIAETEQLYNWSLERSAEIAARESTIQDLIAQALPLSDPAKAKTLGETLDAFVAARLRLWAELQAIGENVGKEQTKPVMIDASRLAELERAAAKIEDIQAQAKIEAERIRLNYQLKLDEAKREQDERLAKAELAAKESADELSRMKQLEDAERHTRNVEATGKATRKMDTAEHDRKKALAQTAAVRELLKPFTTPGYHRWRAGDTMDKQPVSLKSLQALGALDPSTQGLNKLLDIGVDKGDKERPRFGYPGGWNKLNPGQKEELKAIQNHLIDLGEAMVELGMLAP